MMIRIIRIGIDIGTVNDMRVGMGIALCIACIMHFTHFEFHASYIACIMHTVRYALHAL